MEIGLDLLSGQEDKLDTSSDTNIGDIDGLRAGEEVINSPITSSSFKGNLRLNVVENISGGSGRGYSWIGHFWQGGQEL